jgi:hypothetical protein
MTPHVAPFDYQASAGTVRGTTPTDASSSCLSLPPLRQLVPARFQLIAAVVLKGNLVAATVQEPPIPQGYFRRWVEGSDFSLEANTPAAPVEGVFYLLEAGEVRLSFDDFKAATAAYEDLCIAYWEERLSHTDLPTRLLAARGLFRHDMEHPTAGDILTNQGDEKDRAIVGKARQRAAYMRRQGR